MGSCLRTQTGQGKACKGGPCICWCSCNCTGLGGGEIDPGFRIKKEKKNQVGPLNYLIMLLVESQSRFGACKFAVLLDRWRGHTSERRAASSSCQLPSSCLLLTLFLPVSDIGCICPRRLPSVPISSSSLKFFLHSFFFLSFLFSFISFALGPLRHTATRIETKHQHRPYSHPRPPRDTQPNTDRTGFNA